MIYDTLENLPKYRGMNKNLDMAIEFLMCTDLASLPNGRNEVDGDNVFVNVMDAKYRAPEDALFEAHRCYADVQISLTGDERLGWLPIDRLPAFPDGEDNPLFEGHYEPELVVAMRKGVFCILFPQDGHAPGLGQGEGHKLVAKVKMV